MKPIYVSGYDPWPYEYCLWAIQFLAQSERELEKYLPEFYPSFIAEIHTGNQTFVGPLDALIEFCWVCVSPGRTFCEWDEDENEQCGGIEDSCKQLLKILGLMSIRSHSHESECRRLLGTDESNEWLEKLSSCRRIAKTTLDLLGWDEKEIKPVFTAVELLDEMSGKKYQ